mmetsp:Transcript_70168/g.196390  ORF Transcript_70168/g.196390 Transcript_70168/m.196390 type:complete len:214 (-) Transcript_70168:170-811(-)
MKRRVASQMLRRSDWTADRRRDRRSLGSLGTVSSARVIHPSRETKKRATTSSADSPSSSTRDASAPAYSEVAQRRCARNRRAPWLIRAENWSTYDRRSRAAWAIPGGDCSATSAPTGLLSSKSGHRIRHLVASAYWWRSSARQIRGGTDSADRNASSPPTRRLLTAADVWVGRLAAGGAAGGAAAGSFEISVRSSAAVVCMEMMASADSISSW